MDPSQLHLKRIGKSRNEIANKNYANKESKHKIDPDPISNIEIRV
jgi:hypothetical protein